MEPDHNLTIGECRLCKERRPLRQSHFIPKGTYKLLREPGTGNPNPIILSHERAWPSSVQVRDRLFCHPCEQMFDKLGEDWVLRNCYREAGNFPLQEWLRAATPFRSRDGLASIDSRTVAPLDMDKLVYFAVSVFWRSSIHKWRFEGNLLTLPHLGDRYLEEFKLYLLGKGAFPRNAVLLVNVSNKDKPARACLFPCGGRLPLFHHYRFMIPGITFYLFLDARMGDEFRYFCAVNSPHKPIHLQTIVDDAVMNDDVVSFVHKAKPSAKLALRYG
jgi:hypothetical protein